MENFASISSASSTWRRSARPKLCDSIAGGQLAAMRNSDLVLCKSGPCNSAGMRRRKMSSSLGKEITKSGENDRVFVKAVPEKCGCVQTEFSIWGGSEGSLVVTRRRIVDRECPDGHNSRAKVLRFIPFGAFDLPKNAGSRLAVKVIPRIDLSHGDGMILGHLLNEGRSPEAWSVSPGICPNCSKRVREVLANPDIDPQWYAGRDLEGLTEFSKKEEGFVEIGSTFLPSGRQLRRCKTCDWEEILEYSLV